jgi:DNA-binding NtrC family response regulator
MKHEKGTVLVVEDDANQRTIIKTILAGEGFYVDDVGSVKQALDLLKSNTFDVVLTDLRLPDGDGTEVLKEVKTLRMLSHVIIITAFGSIASAVEATKLGAFYYLEKPFEKDQLLLTITNAINQAKLLQDNIRLKNQLVDRFTLDNIIGVHGAMEEVYRMVKKVAPTNSTVLIYGESGTGKELFAKSIHFNSPRKDLPFFAINCAAIPETLLESELFGYEKGAFTGAVARHTGLLEQANGSTLFLDEISDLSLNMQAKLLRALQEREIRRIGGKETLKLNVRILAATNRKLEEEIRKGRFREDLFYRLNVIAFTIPPLRERATDIPILIEHFLGRLNEVHGQRKDMTADALNLLMAYHWPGNVRQLESVLERAYIMTEGSLIKIDQIPGEVKRDADFDHRARPFETVADSLIDARLTAAEYRLYLYLASLVTEPEQLPEALEPKRITERLGINRDTFFVGIARLKELGLYDYKRALLRLKASNRRHSGRQLPSEISD